MENGISAINDKLVFRSCISIYNIELSHASKTIPHISCTFFFFLSGYTPISQHINLFFEINREKERSIAIGNSQTARAKTAR